MNCVKPILIFLTALTLMSGLALAPLAWSEEGEPGGEATPSPAPEATPAPVEETSPPRTYFDYAVLNAQEIERGNDLLLWGRLPMRLPSQTLAARLGFEHRRIDSIFDSTGELHDNLGRFTVPDPFGSSRNFLTVEPTFHGIIDRLNLEASFGVTDSLTWFGRVPMQREELWLDFDFEAGTSSALGIRTTRDWFQTLENIGRPAPRHYYRSKALELGDVETGLSWNYSRSSAAYLSLAGRVSFPTGRLADPNEALIYGLGPQIDDGRGSYGVGLTHRVDFFLPLRTRWIGLVLETSYDYYFKGKRRVPHFLEPDPTFRAQLDRIGVDEAYFPDLSDANDYYYVTPGSQFDYLAGVSLRFHYFGVGAGFTTAWSQEPELEGDREMLELLDATDAYRAQTRMAVVGEIGVPLSPIYVPGVVSLGFRYPVGGRNALQDEDNATAQIELFFPL